MLGDWRSFRWSELFCFGIAAFGTSSVTELPELSLTYLLIRFCGDIVFDAAVDVAMDYRYGTEFWKTSP